MIVEKLLLIWPVALFLVLALFAWRRERKMRGEAVTAESSDAEVGTIVTADLNRGISENISVVLRRQVPVRFDEEARSWLGGLPSMPDGLEWPRGANCPDGLDDGVLRPLHFAAQIACSDLPEDLWAGLGPRKGWLLFFIGANAHIHDADCVRVIHTSELGSEREPPADLDPLSGLTFTYGAFGHWIDPMAVPRQWARWPVDLVVVPNQLHIVDGREAATSANFASQLYDGHPVQLDNGYLSSVEPFTWGCLAQAWADLMNWLTLQRDVPATPHSSHIDLLMGKEDLSTLMDFLQSEVEEVAATLAAMGGLNDEISVQRRGRMASILEVERNALRNLCTILPLNEGAEAVVQFFEVQRLDLAKWRERTLDALSPAREHMARVDWDSPLSPPDWGEFKDHLCQFQYQEYGLTNDREFGLSLTARTRSAWDQFAYGSRIRDMTHEVALRCYTDVKRRHLLPAEAVAAYEAFWRRLEQNRPHRLGGYFDAIQNAPCAGPTATPLLLQLNTDFAMQWLWADVGAIQMWIATGALAQSDFSRLEVREEGG